MLANWVRQTTVTSGTGDLTIAAVSGYPTFSDEFVVGQPFYYALVKDSDGAPVEVGIGKLSSATVLQRTTVLQTFDGSFNNAPSGPVNLSGTHRVLCAGTMQQGGVTAFPGITSVASLRAAVLYPHVAGANTKALVANAPMIVSGRLDASGKGVSALGVNVSTLGGTGTNKMRIGVYSVNTDGSPGALVAETGDMATNTTGLKSASLVGGKKNIPPGWYYFVLLSDVGVTLSAGSTSVTAQVSPLGMVNASTPAIMGNCASVGSGWTSMPASITISSVWGLGSEVAPTIHVYP